MIDVFDQAFETTIGHEGGYVWDADDPGGETKYGISKRQYPRLDIAALTLDDAKEMYRKDYWCRMLCHLVDDPKIAGEMFDTAVNLGIKKASEIVQRGLNYLGEMLEVDGLLGPVTLKALNKWIERDRDAVYKILNVLQGMHYLDIVENNPRFKKYARGWLKRIHA